jgi:hypothetical protein
MDKYNNKTNLYINLPSPIGLTPVPLSSYDIEEWIGKCEDIEVLKYLSRTLLTRIGKLEDNDWDFDIMR